MSKSFSGGSVSNTRQLGPVDCSYSRRVSSNRDNLHLVELRRKQYLIGIRGPGGIPCFEQCDPSISGMALRRIWPSRGPRRDFFSHRPIPDPSSVASISACDYLRSLSHHAKFVGGCVEAHRDHSKISKVGHDGDDSHSLGDPAIYATINPHTGEAGSILIPPTGPTGPASDAPTAASIPSHWIPTAVL
jgi:hypothetical protein